MVVSFDGRELACFVPLFDGVCAGERARARHCVAFHCRRDSKVSTGKFVFVVSHAILASLVGGSSI